MMLLRRSHAGPVIRARHQATALAAAVVVGLGLTATSAVANADRNAKDAVIVVDTSPVNWLSVTWSTMEELVRVDKDGRTVPTLAESYSWIDDKTVEFKLRKGVAFQDGEPFNAKVLGKSFDEVQRWENPHPPGAFLNFAKQTKLDIIDDYTVRFTFPDADSASIMKFRGMHIASSRFWKELGFISKKGGNAEGHW